MKKILKFVLTGSTSVGKTTVIEILKKRGYSTVPEFSRVVIEEEQAKGSDILPWKKTEEFQQLYAERQLREESNIERFLTETDSVSIHASPETASPDLLFMDRCMIDGRAFCIFGSVAIPREIDIHLQKLHDSGEMYDLVFLLDHLPTYTFDSGRKFDEEESKCIQKHIQDAYKHYGYTFITVPYMEPEARADFIVKQAQMYTDYLKKKDTI